MKLPSPHTATLTEDSLSFNRICRAIALRRQLEADTLPAPEDWVPPPARPPFWLLAAVIIAHVAAWILAIGLTLSASH